MAVAMSTDGGHALDLDRRLVRALHQDPRASVVGLAQAIHEPRAVVGERLRALIGSGAIRVVAAVHPHFAGLQVLAHVSVATQGPVAGVAALVAAWPQTVLESIVGGAHDLNMQVRVRTHGELQALVYRVRLQSSVDRTRSMI